tara:strand:- start:1192 stop:1323 length:132 start_codon:yes stop_codon:yes gene_type:complete
MFPTNPFGRCRGLLLLWYATLGAIVIVFWGFDRHPVLYFSMPW